MAVKPLTRGARSKPQTIIIRREESSEAAHHGGAWKVAYADFVTAMMAFFLLMWLLNATTEEQRTGLADYFAPTNLFGRSTSGSGQPFGGKTPNDAGSTISTTGSAQVIHGTQAPQPENEDEDSDTAARVPTAANALPNPAQPHEGNPAQPDATASRPAANGKGDQAFVQGGDYAAARLKPSDQPDPLAPPAARRPGASDDSQVTDAGASPDAARPSSTAAIQAALKAAAREDAARERTALEQAGAQMMDAIRRDPALQEAAGQLSVQLVPEGLRIQAIDTETRPMFALGSAAPTTRVRELMQKIVPVLAGLPNEITIAGHTDARIYRGQERGNWELSADRANATRHLLTDAGLPDNRVRSVTGNADRDLLVPADPMNPANRRITLIVLRHAEQKSGTP